MQTSLLQQGAVHFQRTAAPPFRLKVFHGIRQQRAETRCMRVVIIALAAFALIYVLLVVVNVRGHSGSPLTASGPPSLPGALADSWGITPPFLKVGTRDMYVNALTISGTTLRLTPYVPATISVQSRASVVSTGTRAAPGLRKRIGGKRDARLSADCAAVGEREETRPAERVESEGSHRAAKEGRDRFVDLRRVYSRACSPYDSRTEDDCAENRDDRPDQLDDAHR